MLFPSAEQYSVLIHSNGASAFSSLQDLSFVKAPDGGYIHHQGGSALIFKAGKDGKFFAIRCFLRGEPELFRRYEAISLYLAQKSLPWKLDVDFFDNELQIDDQPYPVVRMEWVEANTLYRFIDLHHGNPQVMSLLQRQLVSLSKNLEQHCIGHGDLNLHHILVINRGAEIQFKLVDYDALFIPGLEGKRGLRTGTPGFQHPKKLANDFSETMDRFSIWVMLTALEALKVNPKLWNDATINASKGQQFFFTLKDLINPGQSRTFQKLRSYPVPSLQYYLDNLTRFCGFRTSDMTDYPVLYETGNADGLKKVLPSTTANAGPDGPATGKSEEKQQGQQGGERLGARSASEIIEFTASKYEVMEGESVRLQWKVGGSGPVHISHVGDVQDRTGQKEVVLHNTTNFTLTVGTQSLPLRVRVQPRPKPLRPRVIKPGKYEMDTGSGGFTWKKAGFVAAGILLLAIGYFAMNGTSGKKPEASEQAPGDAPSAVIPTANAVSFTTPEATDFLNRLYGSYNKRNLRAIIGHYSPSVQTYYDASNLTRDSLTAVIRDLFIKPYFYMCKPDLSTLKMQSVGNNYRIVVLVRETIQAESSDQKENFETTIEYIVDKDYRIVSEKKLS